jgi:hypothetical protein
MSNIFSINLKDFGKALVVVVASAALQFLFELVQAKGFAISADDWIQLLNVAVIAGLGYLVKNVLTNNQGEFLKGDR